jgi:hypothetical protein
MWKIGLALAFFCIWFMGMVIYADISKRKP